MLGLEDKQAPNGKYETVNQRRTREETKENPRSTERNGKLMLPGEKRENEIQN